MWNEHCSYKSLEEVAAHAADHRPAGDLRPRRERRRGRHRRRPGAGLQDGEPQPPLLHRALPGRRHRRRRHPARRLHHGRAPDRGDERAVASASPDHPRTRSLVQGVVAGIGGYGNAFGVPTIGGELRFHPAYDGNCLVNAFAAGLARRRRDLLLRRQRRRHAGRLSRRQDRPRRRRRRHHGERRVRRRRRRQAPDGAGRRPLHREAADGGLPRADGDRRGHLDPGHGRRRPHLLGGRDGRQGDPRASASTSTACRCARPA